MGLYRHHQQMLLAKEWDTGMRSGPSLRVRPQDRDAPDRGVGFRVWALFPARGGDVSTARLVIETSPTGEGWHVLRTLEPSDEPHLFVPTTVATYVRARVYGGGAEVRAWVMLLSNSPFALDGRSTEVTASTPGPKPNPPAPNPPIPKPNPPAPKPNPPAPDPPKPPPPPPKV